MGLSGQVPRRVDAATKTGLLELLDEATDEGWSVRRACAQLELGEVRAHRWLGRRDHGDLTDAKPGGAPMHGLLDDEAEQIVALFHEWGETDRSHRKLAHRGSYLERVWVSPSSVRKVLAAQGLRLRALPRPGRSTRKSFPDWAEYKPNSIWIYDTTHFTACGMAVVTITDLVSRKWLTEIVSVEETSVQVAQAFTDALRLEGLDRARAPRPQVRPVTLTQAAAFLLPAGLQHTVGKPAGNLAEFADTISRCDPAVLRHHASQGDFSRWVDQAIADGQLAVTIRDAEALVPGGDEGVEQARREIVAAVKLRYLTAAS